jgi:hypothetical protein
MTTPDDVPAKRERRPVPPITCSGCPATWTATTAAHCSGCHRTFSGIGLFDLHRSQYGERGSCIDPDNVRNQAGYRVMFHRDGMWRGPESTDEQKARLRRVS